jgi:hypothetical protein
MIILRLIEEVRYIKQLNIFHQNSVFLCLLPQIPTVT